MTLDPHAPIRVADLLHYAKRQDVNPLFELFKQWPTDRLTRLADLVNDRVERCVYQRAKGYEEYHSLLLTLQRVVAGVLDQRRAAEDWPVLIDKEI